MKNIWLAALALLFAACATPPEPIPNQEAGNQRPPREVVEEHLRAVEAGNWDVAEAQISPDFTMQMEGMPRWVKIDRSNALETHRARKRAFPDFRFNEKIEREDGNSVTVAVYLTGTHTGYLDYPINQVPELEATGKSIDLPAEYFTYYIEDDQIRAIFGRIPEGHGPPALKEQLGVE
ncbi:MAG: hypothetical protein GVY29_10590 [Spirochaetes bacterium]|jgi:hypothetical protein|nr:hypothetical protein [Spirochaetota bacterium]